ncbi:MAG: response regulator transcription factor [Bacteroidetes bacterium]|nr:response regulator transcription factor [Bacteroidota bacterium]MCL5025680.1 response regulator transcription factor [Chloroflexota bacterium]
MKVVVVDDEPDVTETVQICFSMRWPDAEVLSAADGRSGVALVSRERPDVVILDIGLPDVDGYEVCREIRDFSDVPIIMLTARGGDLDKVKGLELGADDYITKPFSHIELLARVRALLRRVNAHGAGADVPPYITAELSVDFGSREVRRHGKLVKLTPIEYGLLYHLVRNAGQVLPHRALLAKVWGREYLDEVGYLKVHIRNLRQKIEDDPENPHLIVTERGVGYRFVPAE